MKKAIPIFILIAVYSIIPFTFPDNYPEKDLFVTKAMADQNMMDIILVLDNSGSMKKNDPAFLARDVVTKSLITMSNGSRLGMVLFAEKATLAVGLMETASSSARSKILETLDQVDYRGQLTNTPAAIERAVYELKYNGRKDAEKIIILLTDGIVDTGDKNKDAIQEQWLREGLAQDSKKAGIRIIGVAFTDSADFSLIQTLAVKTDGDYFRAYKAEDIPGIFEKIKKLITVEKKKPEVVEQPPEKVIEPPPVASKVETPPQQGVIAVPPPPPSTVKDSVQERTQPDNSKPNSSLVFLFAVILVLIVITALIIIFYIKSRTEDIKEVTDIDPDMPAADLVDIKNVTMKKVIRLEKKINRIGRDPNNDIVISRDIVSSLHATIEYRDGFFYLEDERSKNGTRLNSEDLSPNSPVRLKSGDVITVDGFRFIFMLPDMIPAGKTAIDFTSGDRSRAGTVPERAGEPEQGELPDLPQVILVDVKNITGRKTIRLEQRVSKIGRDINNDITIPQDTVSSLHATIEYRDGFFFLEDQRSRNTTSLGGEKLEPNTPRKLKSGDDVMFDIYKFIFLLEYQLPSGETGDRTKVW